MNSTVIDTYRTTYNASNLFLTPLLGMTRSKLVSYGFVNSYIKDELRGMDYERGLYLFFRYKEDMDIEDFIEQNRKNLLDQYDYPERHVMLVYQYEEKWMSDVEKIMAGKYSETSSEFKQIFDKKQMVVKSANLIEDETPIQKRIVERDPDLVEYWRNLYNINIDPRSGEVWPFYEEKEIFNEQELNKYL